MVILQKLVKITQQYYWEKMYMNKAGSIFLF